MKLHILTALLLVLLTLTGCTASVRGTVTDPVSTQATVGTQATVETQGAAATQATVDATQLIGEEQAKKIALEQAGLAEADVTRLRVEYEIDDGVQQYDVEFHHGGYEYEYEINANTGAVISFDKDKED